MPTGTYVGWMDLVFTLVESIYYYSFYRDSAFPSLEAVLRQLNDPEAPTLFKLLEQQSAIEKRVRESENHLVPEEYMPPEPVTEFQTARLFLSHFGYLNIGGDKKVLYRQSFYTLGITNSPNYFPFNGNFILLRSCYWPLPSR